MSFNGGIVPYKGIHLAEGTIEVERGQSVPYPSSMRLPRRSFLRKAAVAALGFTIIPRHVLGRGFIPPSETLNHVIVGCGGISAMHSDPRMTGANRIVAICDVDSEHVKRKLEKIQTAGGGNPMQAEDFRDVIAHADADVVHVCTPPHWHGVIAAAAARRGKAVWCEKPLTRTIGEGLALSRVVQQTGVPFRVNTWFRLNRTNYYGVGPAREIRRVVASGVLGGPLTVRLAPVGGIAWKVNLWTGRPDLKPVPVPANLNWDLYCGPSQLIPYHPHRAHGSFRGYWNFDQGGLGDMGQHFLDPVQYFLGKDNEFPVTVECDAPPQDAMACGVWKTVTLTYKDGTRIILESELAERNPDNPFMEGPNGKLFAGMRCDNPALLRKAAEFPLPEYQEDDFDICAREKRPFGYGVNEAFHSSTLVNLAGLSVRLGRKLTFKSDGSGFVGDAQADRLHSPVMRGNWAI
jgi:myo-inositol 2-dehydrogenase / D-chiro-inositol 1-dehydrogenase